MLLPELRDRWLAGEPVVLVAPTLSPLDLAERGRRVLLVTPDDVSALLLGAAIGAPLLLRTTGARERGRALAGGGLLVTSLDSLHLPSYRSLLDGELAGAARVLWGADGLASFGRAAAASMLGPALTVFATRSAAPEGAQVLQGPGGIVRGGEQLAFELVRLGGGVLAGAGPSGASLGGLPVRQHQLKRPFPRGWATAERALRTGDDGIDVIDEPRAVVTAGPGRAVALPVSGPFFAPEGAVVLVDARPAASDVTEAAIDGLRGAVRSGGEGEGAWVTGPADDLALLDGLARVGALTALRPIWTQARVADAQRFRSPFVDAQPAWRELAETYAAALPGWTLAQRSALALSDQAPRDLVELAVALGVRPSLVCDVLMDLDAADLMAARVEGLAFEARPGPRWEAPAAELLAAMQTAPTDDAAWREAQGCRTAAWREANGLERGDDCGLCEVCDPSGAALVGRVAPHGRASLMPPDAGDAPSPGKASLDALFTGLGNGSQSAGPSAGEPLLAALRGGTDEELVAQIAAYGGASQALARALLRYQGEQREAQPSEAVTDLMLAVLTAGKAPWGVLPEGVTAARPGTWSLQHPTDGKWTFLRRAGSRADEPEFLRRIEQVSPGAPAVSKLAAARAAGAAWDALGGQAEAVVRGALKAPGDPDLTALRAELAQARAALEAAVGRPAEGLPGLAELLGSPERDAARLRPWLEVFLARAEPPLDARLAARWASVGRLPLKLSAAEALRWAKRDRLALDRQGTDWLLSCISQARRADIAALLAELGEGWRHALREVGLTLGALPKELLPEALTSGDVLVAAKALTAAAADTGRAARLWRDHQAELAAFELSALRDAFERLPGAVARSLAQKVDEAVAEQEAEVARRAAVLELAEAGRLGEAAERLAALATEGVPADVAAALDRVRRQAVQRQSALVAPVAAVLAGAGGDEAEDEAFAAIEDAVSEGFGSALVALLSRQHRRAPEDAVRALWLARALCIHGDWAEGERVYEVAAALRADVTARVATEFEGIFLAFEANEVPRALRWVRRVLQVPWHQVLLPHVQSLLDEGVVPATARAELAAALDATGSPFYSKVVHTLRGE